METNTIDLASRRPRSIRKRRVRRVVAFASGKGGVGKTNIVANLGFSLRREGVNVLVFDADMGLGNMDVLLGMANRYDLSHVLTKKKDLSDILMAGPGGMKILPAASGIWELTNLKSGQRKQILEGIERAIDPFDFLLIDTPAGISSDVLFFSASAREIIVVVTPDPASLTDAYALMKVLAIHYGERWFHLIVNQAGTEEEAEEVFFQLNRVGRQLLDVSLNYLGHIPFDPNLVRSVRRQRVVCEQFPESAASREFRALSERLLAHQPVDGGDRTQPSLWKRIASGTDPVS